MNTAIVLRSRYGTTESCAEELATLLPDDVRLFDLRRDKAPNLTPFDTVVIGAPVYGGRIPNDVRRFCDRSRRLLLSRRVGLFICCLYDGQKADEQLETSFAPWLTAHSQAADWFGGAVEVARLRIVDRFLFRLVAGVNKDIDRVHHDRIKRFAAVLSPDSRS